MARRVMPRIVPLTISLLIAVTLVVPAAYFSFAYAHRWWMVHGLTASATPRRKASLEYVAEQADEDPEVLAAAVDALAVHNDRNFRQIVHAIDRAGKWDRERIPLDDWLRWIKLTAASEPVNARIAATQSLADLPQHADDPRVIQPLRRLIDDHQADVRFNAMIAAAELLLASKPTREVYERMVGSRIHDHPAIARHAFIILGLIDPIHGFSANWQTAPGVTAQAMVWATARTNPKAFGVGPSVSQIDPKRLEALAYAYAVADSPAAHKWLADRLPANRAELANLSHARRRMVWRSALGVRMNPNVQRKLQRWVRPGESKSKPIPSDASLPLRLAGAYRLGRPQPLADHARPTQVLMLLARLEGTTADHPQSHKATSTAGLTNSPRPTCRAVQPPRARLAAGYDPLTRGSTAFMAMPDNWPMLHRVAGLDDVAKPTPKDLAMCFQSQASTMRDIACLAAVERFDRDTLKPSIARLITSYNDEQKMSGAVLAGLTGLQTALLARRHEVEDIPAVKQVMALGLWMAGKTVGPSPGMDIGTAEGLLVRKKIGFRSTVLLAMLQRGMKDPDVARVALDFLLKPRGEPEIDLIELFDKLRWIRVLEHYLPRLFDARAPRFWLWADRGLQDFQIDVMRDWYLLHRGFMTTSRSHGPRGRVE